MDSNRSRQPIQRSPEFARAVADLVSAIDRLTALLRRHSGDGEYLTPPQVAASLGVDVKRVLAWIHTGELRAANLATRLDGRPRYRVSRESLDSFLSSRAVVMTTGEKTPRRRRRIVAFKKTREWIR